MSLRTSLIPTVEYFRSISGPTFADIRTNQLTIRTRVWSGGQLRLGAAIDSDLVLPPHYPIRYLNSREVSSSAGKYVVGDILVDHITPSDGLGTGYSLEQLSPELLNNASELIYIITGTHAGEYCSIETRTYRPFTYQLVLRNRS